MSSITPSKSIGEGVIYENMKLANKSSSNLLCLSCLNICFIYHTFCLNFRISKNDPNWRRYVCVASEHLSVV